MAKDILDENQSFCRSFFRAVEEQRSSPCVVDDKGQENRKGCIEGWTGERGTYPE
ncbi:unnamed protein product [Musa acuminata subsp. burmannicoides]